MARLLICKGKKDLQFEFLLTFLVNIKCNTDLAKTLFNFDIFKNYIKNITVLIFHILFSHMYYHIITTFLKQGLQMDFVYILVNTKCNTDLAYNISKMLTSLKNHISKSTLSVLKFHLSFLWILSYHKTILTIRSKINVLLPSHLK